tara:strand:- start:217 stop:1146 length:930 start_codon:yes stop_codon:yes gene_type:complete
MKKLLGLFVVCLIFTNVCYAEKSAKLPKDVVSGSKFHKSLTGKYYKKYGFQIVNKEDGYPVRAGNKSIRFEVRDGDCGKDDDGEWSDCKGDRERHELSGGESKMSSGEYWFSWSLYFPEEHQNLWPLSNNYGQFHQKKGPPVFMFKELRGGYYVVRTIGDVDYDERRLIRNDDIKNKWHDILINVKWSKKDDGFFKVWVNEKLKYDYKGPTKTLKYVYQKFGIYSTGITRYINYENIDNIEKCFDEQGRTTDENTALYTLYEKKIKHDISVQIYDKCKSYFKSVKIPTRVVYFDEVRKSKKKKKVGIIE